MEFLGLGDKQKVGSFFHDSGAVTIFDPSLYNCRGIQPSIPNVPCEQLSMVTLWLAPGKYNCYKVNDEYIIILEDADFSNVEEGSCENYACCAFSGCLTIASNSSDEYNNCFLELCNEDEVQFFVDDMLTFLTSNNITVSRASYLHLYNLKGSIVYMDEVPADIRQYVGNINNTSFWYYLFSTCSYSSQVKEFSNGICLGAFGFDYTASILFDDDCPIGIRITFAE